MATNLDFKFNLIYMEVLQNSFQLYKKSIWTCLPLSLAVALGINAPFLFFEYEDALDFLVEVFSWQDYKSALMIFIWLVTFIALEALILKINSLKINKEDNLANNITQAVAQFFPMIMVSVLYSIIVVCGMVFLVVPGLVFSITLMFSFIIRLLEHHSTMDCLIISHRLVWGKFWYALLVLSVPLLLNLAIFLAIFISTVGILTQFSSTWEHAYFFAFLLNTALQVIFIPFIFSTILSLFYDLKSHQTR